MLVDFKHNSVEAYEVIAIDDISSDQDGLMVMIYMNNGVRLSVKEPLERVRQKIKLGRTPEEDKNA
jgi:hypothetical protein